MSDWEVVFKRSELDGRPVLSVAGEIDLAVAGRFAEELDSLVGGDHGSSVVDLSAVEFIDSSGLGALVGAHKAVQQSGGDLRLAAAPNQVRMVLRLTNLDQVLPNHASAEEAFDVD